MSPSTSSSSSDDVHSFARRRAVARRDGPRGRAGRWAEAEVEEEVDGVETVETLRVEDEGDVEGVLDAEPVVEVEVEEDDRERVLELEELVEEEEVRRRRAIESGDILTAFGCVVVRLAM